MKKEKLIKLKAEYKALYDVVKTLEYIELIMATITTNWNPDPKHRLFERYQLIIDTATHLIWVMDNWETTLYTDDEIVEQNISKFRDFVKAIIDTKIIDKDFDPRLVEEITKEDGHTVWDYDGRIFRHQITDEIQNTKDLIHSFIIKGVNDGE